MSGNLKAGAAAIDISPVDSQFLFGYPHVERYSEGIHDRLWASALYLTDGVTQMIFVANDIIYVSKEIAASARAKINAATGVPQNNIMLTATHTHSGPIVKGLFGCSGDKVVPSADKAYEALFENKIVEAAIAAFKSPVAAKVGLGLADASCVGTNRRDPKGPADPQMPVLSVKDIATDNYLAVMVVCSMHPTVLHEDSKLVSGDFPGMSRVFLQDNVVGGGCVVLHHSGPCGNQSPRHVTRENTYAEAIRLGSELGKNIEKSLAGIRYTDSVKLQCKHTCIEFPRRKFPDVATAQKKLDNSIARLKHLRDTNAPRTEIRTAECDWFGAEETFTLAAAEAAGKLDAVAAACMPAEIQVFSINNWKFVAWQGEIFVEYALAVKAESPDTFVISCANGEFSGYIVTQAAADEGGYEASNAMFAPQSGDMLVKKSLELIKG